MTFLKHLLPAVVLLAGLVVAAGALLTTDGVYVDYQMAGGTMSPTLTGDDRLTVRTDTADELRRGDIVVIDPEFWPMPAEAAVVKRVVGIGGDRVRGKADGRIEVNGHAIDEDYLSSLDDGPEGFPEFDVTVPDGTVFVAGDQRNNSVDSRVFVDEPNRGAFEFEAVWGTVVAVNGDSLPATTAFIDAGLPGDAYDDTALGGTRLLVLIAGAVVAVVGAVWLVLSLVRRHTKVMAEAGPGGT